MRRYTLIAFMLGALVLSLGAANAGAQNISGTWKGVGGSDGTYIMGSGSVRIGVALRGLASGFAASRIRTSPLAGSRDRCACGVRVARRSTTR